MLERRYTLALGVLERDRVAGTDCPLQLRQRRLVHGRCDTYGDQRGCGYENGGENN
jgi:hypothetical protein